MPADRRSGLRGQQVSEWDFRESINRTSPEPNTLLVKVVLVTTPKAFGAARNYPNVSQREIDRIGRPNRDTAISKLSPKLDHNRVSLAAKHRRRCSEPSRSKSFTVYASADRAAGYGSYVLPICTEHNQAIATELLRPACHESDDRASTATNRRRLRVQITNHIVWAIWRPKENRHGILVIDESASGDWPILLSATVRSKICHRAAH